MALGSGSARARRFVLLGTIPFSPVEPHEAEYCRLIRAIMFEEEVIGAEDALWTAESLELHQDRALAVVRVEEAEKEERVARWVAGTAVRDRGDQKETNASVVLGARSMYRRKWDATESPEGGNGLEIRIVLAVAKPAGNAHELRTVVNKAQGDSYRLLSAPIEPMRVSCRARIQDAHVGTLFRHHVSIVQLYST
ncbi:hypothetical protein DFH09DRAFT_1071450 [Mycena vulgaris]|nr:hypothetical protein DFH09DRAFT_1071450 [Mycena vulgaris]